MKWHSIPGHKTLLALVLLSLCVGCSQKKGFIPPVVDKGVPINFYNPYKIRQFIHGVPETSTASQQHASKPAPSAPVAATVFAAEPSPAVSSKPIKATTRQDEASPIRSSEVSQVEVTGKLSNAQERLLRAQYVGGNPDAAFTLAKALIERGDVEEGDFILDYAARHGHQQARTYQASRRR